MNCVIIDDDPIQHALIEEYLKEIDSVNCIGVFHNPIQFLKVQEKLKYDLIILDVEMPKMSGIDLLESFSEPKNVLVMSSKSEYAIKVINHNVLGYLLKPIKFIDFITLIKKIKKKVKDISLVNQEGKDNLFIKSSGMLYNLKYSDITHITAAVDYIEIFTTSKKYLVHSSMDKTERKLPNDTFFRIHRSTIINIHHINRIDNEFIEVGEYTVKIAPSKKSSFKAFINSL